MFKIRDIEIKNKFVLAPMAGYTNRAYREIMKEMNVGLVYTEMVSAKGLLYENDKTWELTEVSSFEKPISLQLFGGEVEDMVKAAILVDQKSNADIIDINMGCPVRKVLKAEAGSKLLTDIPRIKQIVGQMVRNVNKPITVKIRSGWDYNTINGPEVARAIEESGASAIAVHGRTKTDLYGGKVNLDWIRSVKEAVKIPVIGNGDIKSIEDAKKMFEYTNVDAIMIGRGTFGNPWLIRDLVDYFDKGIIHQPPTKKEKVEMCIKHFNKLLDLKGEKLALLEMRSLAGWYVKGIANSKEFKQKLVNVKSSKELFDLLVELVNKD